MGAGIAASADPEGTVELAVVEAGRGGRPLLLVHGFTGAKEDFADWTERFAADGWWVVAPDLRGHGQSGRPAEEAAYSLRTFVDDLLALADRLGWVDFHLLGHSMGGMVAQELALRTPERVSRLLLMDTHHGPVGGFDDATLAVGLDVLRRQGIGGLVDLLSLLPAREPAPAEVRLRAERPGYEAWCDSKLRSTSAAMYASMAQEITRGRDRLADLAGLRVPTRVVVGAQDRDFLAPSERLAATIPGADLVVVPDAAHSPQFENPEAWWIAVTSFLGGRSEAA